MLKKFSKWLQQISKGWVVLSAMVLFGLFVALVMPDQASHAAASGMDKSPDLSLFYTANDLYEMAEAYGEQGRDAYIKMRFSFDLVWPLVYMVFLTSMISWIYRRAFRADSTWQFANLAPIFGMVFDYFENIAAAVVMVRYPDTTPVVDQLTAFLTLIKWVFVGGSFVLLVIGVVGSMRRGTPP